MGGVNYICGIQSRGPNRNFVSVSRQSKSASLVAAFDYLNTVRCS